jgi:hypothetical protein
VSDTLTEIIQQHGGDRAFSLPQLLCARTIAMALDGELVIGPDRLQGLLAMLPSRPDESGADLARLSDRELAQLRRLVAAARDDKRPPAPAPRQTTREHIAQELAQLLDRIDAKERKGRKPTDRELTRARSLATSLVLPIFYSIEMRRPHDPAEMPVVEQKPDTSLTTSASTPATPPKPEMPPTDDRNVTTFKSGTVIRMRRVAEPTVKW